MDASLYLTIPNDAFKAQTYCSAVLHLHAGKLNTTSIIIFFFKFIQSDDESLMWAVAEKKFFLSENQFSWRHVHVKFSVSSTIPRHFLSPFPELELMMRLEYYSLPITVCGKESLKKNYFPTNTSAQRTQLKKAQENTWHRAENLWRHQIRFSLSLCVYEEIFPSFIQQHRWVLNEKLIAVESVGGKAGSVWENRWGFIFHFQWRHFHFPHDFERKIFTLTKKII